MNKKRVAALALAASLATSFGFSTSAFASPESSAGESPSAAQRAPQSSSQAATRDGAASVDLSSQPVSTTAQCDRPVAKRTGAWTCPGSVDQQSGDTNSASADPDLGASEAETGGYCLSFAPECWGVTNDFHAEFNGENTYGYKDKVLGTVDMETTWQLSGTQSVSKPVIADFSDPVRNVIFETDRLYYNQSHRSGAYFNPPQHDFKTWATAIGQKKWPGRGAVLREGTAYLGGVMQVFSWQVPGYSGTWTTYMKSPQFEKDGDVYRFIGKHNLPQDAWNAYYRP